MRVGIFGGTFDPPHLGHLAVAVDVAWELGLDEVRWVVVGDPWQKTALGAGRTVTPGPVRWEMVLAAIAGHGGQVASDVELRRSGPSYMVDTLREFASGPSSAAGSGQPADDLVLLLGADAARNLPTWHDAVAVSELARIAVFSRAGLDAGAVVEELGAAWSAQPVEATNLDISSTDIRRRVAEKRPIDGLVAPGVCTLIGLHGLYGVGG